LPVKGIICRRRLTIGYHFNDTAVGHQAKVMSRRVMREAHGLVAATFDHRMMARMLLMYGAILHRAIFLRMLG
jgi:hypothetical protein